MRITQLHEILSTEQIQRRIGEMGREINAFYKGEPLVAVCVLKGAFMFFSDLVKHLEGHPQLDFVRLASYGNSTTSSRSIKFSKDIEIDLKGKHVLIVEDIVDTGRSMHFLFHQFEARGAKSLRLAALVDKKMRREVPVTVDFVGFTLPVGFIVGYGLDYAEEYRELPAIYEADVER